MQEKLFIYGAGGHSKVVIEIAEELKLSICGLVDSNSSGEKLFGYSITKHPVIDESAHWIIAIGNNRIRRQISLNENFSYATLVHPLVRLSSRATVGQGTVIMAGVAINSDVKIGDHCIINTNASVDHDCVIANYVHLSPNVALAGSVIVGEGAHIGIGACVIQGKKIGKWSTIGAGAVIINDVPDGATVVGNPGRVIKI